MIGTIAESGLFDPDYYLSFNPDVAAAGVDPLRHYLNFGAAEFRNPRVDFDTWFYTKTNETVFGRPEEAFFHYVCEGRTDGRPTRQADSIVFADEREPALLSGSRIAVHLHLFYPELLDEFIAALTNMPASFDLYVSVCGGGEQAVVEDHLDRCLPGIRVEVRALPNRGRDIAPFLLGFSDVWPRYELVCHLHSKRSQHFVHGDHWRREVLARMFGSPKIAAACLAHMRAHADCGFLFPENIREIKRFVSWGEDLDPLHRLFGRLGLMQPRLPRAPDFAAGSMGWFRPAALQPVFNAGLRLEEFDPEQRQLDGTLAHSFERAFPTIVREAGYRSVTYYLKNRPPRTAS